MTYTFSWVLGTILTLSWTWAQLFFKSFAKMIFTQLFFKSLKHQLKEELERVSQAFICLQIKLLPSPFNMCPAGKISPPHWVNEDDLPQYYERANSTL